ncbi:MAG: AraC family transcriptional regulator [Steroidobacteraceae bacterium]
MHTTDRNADLSDEIPAAGSDTMLPALRFCVPARLTQPPVIGPGSSIFGSAANIRRIVAPEAGHGYIDEVAFATRFVGGYCHFRFDDDCAAQIPGEDLLKFHFKLNGRNTLEFRNGSVSTTIGGGEMAVLIHPRGLSKRDCHPRHVEEHSLTFACRPEFLTSTLNVDPDTLPEPLRSYAVGRDPAFYLRSFPFTASVRRDLKALLSRPSNGRFSQVRAQARSLDLIATILEILSGDMSESPRTRMTPRDIRSLEEIRAFLDTAYASAPTIAMLARRAGMNRTKLTQGFRTIFDESIQSYCQRLCMQEARRLLEAGSRVGEVAEAVGYEHQSSFAQAFRGYFGVSPKAIRGTAPR